MYVCLEHIDAHSKSLATVTVSISYVYTCGSYLDSAIAREGKCATLYSTCVIAVA